MNTTALAIIQPDELETIQRTGRMLAASGYFDAKGDSVQSIAMMATKILAGREIGIGPFASVNGIHIISGKPSIGANLLASAVKGSHRYDYRVREMTEKVCKIEFFQRSGEKWESLGISEFSAEEARKAGTKNMDKFPKNMLFARAMSNGVRFYVPDVFNGNAVYVPEELGAEVDADGNVIEVMPVRVDASDSERADNLDNDIPFDKPAKEVLSEQQLKVLNTVGSRFYGDEWDEQRPKLVEAITKGAVTSSKELTPKQADRLIAGIEKKQKEADILAGEKAQAEELVSAPF